MYSDAATCNPCLVSLYNTSPLIMRGPLRLLGLLLCGLLLGLLLYGLLRTMQIVITVTATDQVNDHFRIACHSHAL